MTSHRILIHSHDTYGLGHLRRSTLIAEALIKQPWVESVLITTGSPRAQAFSPVPGVDTVKLPAAIKASDGSYQARTLGVPFEDMVALRASVIRTTVEAYRPDLVLVDHAPLGMRNELLPMFEATRRSAHRPRFVLGLRDIIDGRNAVRDEWSRSGAWDALRDVYDRVVVYGDPSVRTTAQELDLQSATQSPVVHVGYLGRPGAVPTRSNRPTILVTAGGGGDGQAVMRSMATALEGIDASVDLRVDVVTGPFLSEARRRELRNRFEALPCSIGFSEFEPGLEDMVGRAWGVVAMAGYNTVVELLRSGRPALLAPRTQPRKEQAIRAVRLARHAPFEVSLGARQIEGRIRAFIERVLNDEGHEPTTVQLGGLAALVSELKATLESESRVNRIMPGGWRAIV